MEEQFSHEFYSFDWKSKHLMGAVNALLFSPEFVLTDLGPLSNHRPVTDRVTFRLWE
jgi:hypothetical protein